MSDSSKSTIRPRYALQNTYSGQAGELAVSALLVRAGLRVARPFWSDDFTDLLIIQEAQGWTIPIPVQVKSVQQASKKNQEVSIEGLRKSYIEEIPQLCLAIYSPAHDKIWFIPGADNIRKAYRTWYERERPGPGRKPLSYDEIPKENDVHIRVDVSSQGDNEFDTAWLVDRKSPIDLWQQIRDLSEDILNRQKKRDEMSPIFSSWLKQLPPEESAEAMNSSDSEDPPS